MEDTIKELIIDGLCTGGAHHKQWYLQQILKTLGFNEKELKEEYNKNDYDWEDGIAP